MIDILGYVAAFITTSSFVPQVIKTVKTKDTSGISILMYSLFFIGIILWLVYGILINSKPIIFANGLTAIFSAIILYYKITEPKRIQKA